MFRLLVIERGFDAEYFMDRMKVYEALECLASLHYGKKEEWEQARFIAYMVGQVNSTKTLKLTDIIRFPWDEDVEEVVIDENEIKRLQERTKLIEKKLNGRLSNKTTA